MPNIKSQKKRVITNNKRNLAVSSQKSSLRTSIKALKAAIDAADKDLAVATLALVNSKLDKAVVNKIYHKNYASRQKARLAKSVNAIA